MNKNSAWWHVVPLICSFVQKCVGIWKFKTKKNQLMRPKSKKKSSILFCREFHCEQVSTCQKCEFLDTLAARAKKQENQKFRHVLHTGTYPITVFCPPDIRQVPQLLCIISPLSELKNINWAIFYSVFKKNPKNTRFWTVFCDFLKTLKENFGKLFLLVLGTNSGCYGRKFSLLARSSRSRLFLAKFRWTKLPPKGFGFH